MEPFLIDVAPVLAAVEQLLRTAVAVTLGMMGLALLAVGITSLFDDNED